MYHQDQNFLDGSEYVLANIPEFPSAGDVMNIQTLHSKEGTMDPIWFNMYGVRPKEKKAGMTSLLHASAFMGRILMSFHLISDERPKMQPGVQISAASKDYTTSYKLWIDLYELVNCDALYDAHVEPSTFVTVQAFLNGRTTEKKRAERNPTNTSLGFKDEKMRQLDV